MHHYHGVRSIHLENQNMAVCVLPDLGGKIWSILDKRTGQEWLWQNPLATLLPVPFGSSYDDHWAGGWDDLFPNDAACQFDGLDLPDHGEWWCQPWKTEILERSKDKTVLHLCMNGKASPTLSEKWVRLDENASSLKIRYRIQNLSHDKFRFLLKLHPAMAIQPWHRIELPGGDVEPVDLEFSTLLGSNATFSWPIGQNRQGSSVDLSMIHPKESKHREFVYVRNVSDGWCGIHDPRSQSRFRLFFPKSIFPHVWLFMTYGGWRDHYTVVLEPCTNIPKDLYLATRSSQCGELLPKDVLDYEVEVMLEDGTRHHE